ncbi:MAG: esterase family protein [Acholeplasmatales bacterium]|nr:esterase family protein [Acholeplasmatales bacterium]
MIDGFKLTAVTLRRNLKVSVYIPDDYYKTGKSLPLCILFDGQYYFKFLNEEPKLFNMNDLLIKENRQFIVVAPHAPREDMPDWRKSELNPYYQGEMTTVEPDLALRYANYITNELIPIIKMKYRITDEIYLMGVEDSAILSLFMVYSYDIYKGAIMYYPNLVECNHKVFEDLDIRLDNTKRIYLYQGDVNESDKESESFYDLQSTIANAGAPLILDYDMGMDNSWDSIKLHMNMGFDMIDKKN